MIEQIALYEEQVTEVSVLTFARRLRLQCAKKLFNELST